MAGGLGGEMQLGLSTVMLLPEKAKALFGVSQAQGWVYQYSLGELGRKGGRISDLLPNRALAYQVSQGELLRL